MTSTEGPKKVTCIVGPAGSGKTTIMDGVLSKRPTFKRCITSTTRSPRSNEIHGIHYMFFSEEDFEKQKQLGKFLETAQVHGRHWYGTRRNDFMEAVKRPGHTILSIDVQGFLALKQSLDSTEVDIIGIFIDVPEPWEETLTRRLLEGRSESAEETRRRIQTARHERSMASAFDTIIINRDGGLDTAISETLLFIDRRIAS